MSTFDGLVASRKAWISEVLQPWCQAASLTALLQAEQEWIDIAGKVAPEKTLWAWAWARFPDLVHETLGIEETAEVEVTLRDGRMVRGFPDARSSIQGKLVLWGTMTAGDTPRAVGPFSIEDITSVTRLASGD